RGIHYALDAASYVVGGIMLIFFLLGMGSAKARKKKKMILVDEDGTRTVLEEVDK
nr:hypothetical protein [Bdellovibrionales bacterium]